MSGCAHQINPASKQCFQTLQQAKPIVGGVVPVGVEKLNQKIHVAACRFKVSSSGGAKQFQLLDAVPTAQLRDLPAMFLDEIDHSVRGIIHNQPHSKLRGSRGFEFYRPIYAPAWGARSFCMTGSSRCSRDTGCSTSAGG